MNLSPIKRFLLRFLFIFWKDKITRSLEIVNKVLWRASTFILIYFKIEKDSVNFWFKEVKHTTHTHTHTHTLSLFLSLFVSNTIFLSLSLSMFVFVCMCVWGVCVCVCVSVCVWVCKCVCVFLFLLLYVTISLCSSAPLYLILKRQNHPIVRNR